MVKIHIKKVLFIQKIVLKLNQIHGKQLSYNNYNDIFSALQFQNTSKK
jgi:phosphoribosylaminoimidazolecarboxamide formyltransferase/IMP cyclohydrolase